MFWLFALLFGWFWVDIASFVVWVLVWWGVGGWFVLVGLIRLLVCKFCVRFVGFYAC